MMGLVHDDTANATIVQASHAILTTNSRACCVVETEKDKYIIRWVSNTTVVFEARACQKTVRFFVDLTRNNLFSASARTGDQQAPKAKRAKAMYLMKVRVILRNQKKSKL
jgi:hypothetical protein